MVEIVAHIREVLLCRARTAELYLERNMYADVKRAALLHLLLDYS